MDAELSGSSGLAVLLWSAWVARLVVAILQSLARAFPKAYSKSQKCL